MTTGRVPLPVYRASIIYACPRCDTDLEHAGADEYWCAGCQHTVYFTEVVPYHDGSFDD